MTEMLGKPIVVEDVPVMPEPRESDEKADLEALQTRCVGLPTWEPMLDPDEEYDTNNPTTD